MKNLDDIKEGDKVAYTNQWYSTGWHEGYHIWQPMPVQKATKTQLTVNGEVFLRRTGRRLGDTHSFSNRNSQVEVWTDEMAKKIVKTELAIEDHKLRCVLLGKTDKVQFKYLDTQKLQRIVQVLEND